MAAGSLMWRGLLTSRKVDEFRSNNVVLMKQLDELKARFNGIDLEETKALKESILTRHLIEAGEGYRGAEVGDG